MQNKYILENYYTHKSVGLNHLNAVYVTEFTHILASFWKILSMSPSSERGTGVLMEKIPYQCKINTYWRIITLIKV